MKKVYKMKIVKILITILAICMMFAILVACGNDTSGTTVVLTPPPNGTAEQAIPPEQISEPTPDEEHNNDEQQNGSDPATVILDVSIGDIVLFGGIDWRVLDVQGGRALLFALSDVSNGGRRFDAETFLWEDSEIRQWLNGEFYQNTFNAEERARIAETQVTTAPSTTIVGSGNMPVQTTSDKIFLLSLDEAERYTELIIIDQEGWTAPSGGGITELHFSHWWWTRTPVGNFGMRGAVPNVIALTTNTAQDITVFSIDGTEQVGGLDGLITLNETFYTNASVTPDSEVRPAMWVDLG